MKLTVVLVSWSIEKKWIFAMKVISCSITILMLVCFVVRAIAAHDAGQDAAAPDDAAASCLPINVRLPTRIYSEVVTIKGVVRGGGNPKRLEIEVLSQCEILSVFVALESNVIGRERLFQVAELVDKDDRESKYVAELQLPSYGSSEIAVMNVMVVTKSGEIGGVSQRVLIPVRNGIPDIEWQKHGSGWWGNKLPHLSYGLNID
jgi:hypothetical protein